MRQSHPNWKRRMICLCAAFLVPLSSAFASPAPTQAGGESAASAAPAVSHGEEGSPLPSAAAPSASAAVTPTPQAAVPGPASPQPSQTASDAAAAVPSQTAASSATAAPSAVSENFWVEPLKISGWQAGQTPNVPTAQPRFGTVSFYYGKTGTTMTTTPPDTAGTWICRAYVPAGHAYTSLSAEVTFTVTAGTAVTPAVPENLTGTYRSSLRSVSLPDGFAWEKPSALLSANVGIHSYPAVYTAPDGSTQTMEIPVTITPAPASSCHISAITDEYEARNIVITKGTYRLRKGTDYTVSSSVKDGTVTVTIDFIGNFTGTEVRTFTCMETNTWIIPLSMASWTEGSTPSAPQAESRYGTVVFTYYEDGRELAGCPSAPGTYTVRAEVPASDYYSSLSQEVTFTIHAYPGGIPIPRNLSGIYRRSLGNTELPDGFTWVHPQEMLTENVGIHDYPALYSPKGVTVPIDVMIPVRVDPAPGDRCNVSPVTDEAQARNIRITDGTFRLVKGVDYDVDSAISGNVVTVTIVFKNNYYGTVTRTFTFETVNEWTVPLSMRDWTQGQTPQNPVAEAKYGTPVFTYYKNGRQLPGRPSAPGTYTVKAMVVSTVYYPEISAETAFTIYPRQPEDIPVPAGLKGVYRTALGSVKLPDGFAWSAPDALITEDVGVRTFPAEYTEADGTSVRVMLPVTVEPAPGSRCTISPVRNDAEASHLVITDGSYTLVKGTDYTVSSRVEDNLVTVTITFIGNYTGTEERTFTYRNPNEWTEPLTIDDWCTGETPCAPHAAAKFGTPVYTYLVDGSYRTAPPTVPGTYTVRAVVPASPYYASLEAEIQFRVYAAMAPEISELSAVYGDTLQDIALPDGFSWESPGSYVGSVGTHRFPAHYARTEEYLGGTVSVTVHVTPRNGALCSISPITNEYEGRHIVITDNGIVLTKGTDYTVSSSVNGNEVTVTIDFIGNYFGTVTRTFTFQWDNEWVVQPAIADWVTGHPASSPVGEAEYGITQFTYLVDGVYQDAPPVRPGVYRLRAVVPAASQYRGLEAEVTFTIFDAVAPEIGVIAAIYGQELADLALPAGFAWDHPSSYVGNVGERNFPATYTARTRTAPEFMGGQVQIEVRVRPRNGALCTISPIHDEYDARHIVVTDEGVALEKGVDYTVSSEVHGNDVTVSIHFEGNYYGTVTRTFTVEDQNEWIKPLFIADWTYGESPAVPTAEARYGTPVFSYIVNGVSQADPPKNAGTYTVCATVPRTDAYGELKAEAVFEIYPAPAPLPSGSFTAVYLDTLQQVGLPEEYAWMNPAQPVGDVGSHVFAAQYTAPAHGNYLSGTVDVPVRVTPRNGPVYCSISPITNDYEAARIIIRDGSITLQEGKDYTVRTMQDGRMVTVQITFIGNYYGSTDRTFTLKEENYWTVPLSIADWTAGETPSVPVAEARYGTVTFTYASSEASVRDSAQVPTVPGTYVVRARVAATSEYNGLFASRTFHIFASAEPSGYPQPTPSAAPSGSSEPSASATMRPEASSTVSGTAVPSAGVTAAPPASQSTGSSPSASGPATAAPSAPQTPDISPMPSGSVTAVPSASQTPDVSPLPSGSATAAPSASQTPDVSAAPSGSVTEVPSASPIPDASSSGSTFPSSTQTADALPPSGNSASGISDPAGAESASTPGESVHSEGVQSSADNAPKTNDDRSTLFWWELCAAGTGLIGITLFMLRRRRE